jgi:polysaccharide biosynthesis protein PslH
MLAHRLPYPPTTGDRVRAYHVARGLSARHDVTLAAPLSGPEEVSALQTLQAYIPDMEYVVLRHLRRWARAVAGLAIGRPISVGYFRSPALAGRIRARVHHARYDAVYVSSSSMMQYAPSGVPVVVDFVDVDSEKFSRYAVESVAWLRWLYRLEAHRLRRYERTTARDATVSVFVTEAEARCFRSIAPEATIAVIPNGVDTEYFHGPTAVKNSAPTVIFTGALDYLPNIDAVRYFSDAILPHVRRYVPEVRFVVVGRRPGRPLRRLAERPGISIVGDVPDIRQYLSAAHVAVAPLRIACGIPNKVLEAMAMGLPVVTTPATAPAIEADVDMHWFVERSAERFGIRVAQLLRDADQRMRVGIEARRLVKTRYSWMAALGRLEGLIETTAQSSATRDVAATVEVASGTLGIPRAAKG